MHSERLDTREHTALARRADALAALTELVARVAPFSAPVLSSSTPRTSALSLLAAVLTSTALGQIAAAASPVADLLIATRRLRSTVLLAPSEFDIESGPSTGAAAPVLDGSLLHGTLALNLLLERRWPPQDDDLELATTTLEDLGLDGFLARLPSGLGQFVGEVGWPVSDGERTRLLLARALLSGGQVTRLDDAFLGLDAPCALMVARALSAAQ
jgi:hypothetical protein